jgi:hypothetical protein
LISSQYLDHASPLYANVEDALAGNIRLAGRGWRKFRAVHNVVYEADGADGGLFTQKIRRFGVL